tara:strand:+ start:1041 stop:1352 length:312 start_codon:yes stop_codon:yes gene_type:complete
MDLKLIEIQKQLSENERNVFNYKFERQKRSVSIYAILAFFLGGLGAHKFYFGQIALGIIYALFVWTFIPSIIAFIESILSSKIVASKNFEIAQEIYEEIRLLR